MVVNQFAVIFFSILVCNQWSLRSHS